MFFEKRKYERFDFSKELIIAAENHFEKKAVQFYANTLNISRGGMFIYTIAQFKPKTRCHVKFKSNSFEGIESRAIILRSEEENRPGFLKETEHMYALEFEKVFSEDELGEILKKLPEKVIKN